MKTLIKVIIIFIITSCHKFEENTLLFKNIPLHLSSRKWKVYDAEVNNRKILKNEFVYPYFEEDYNYRSRIQSQKKNIKNNLIFRIYYFQDKFDDTLKDIYDPKNSTNWRIILMNSMFLKIGRYDKQNNHYVIYLK